MLRLNATNLAPPETYAKRNTYNTNIGLNEIEINPRRRYTDSLIGFAFKHRSNVKWVLLFIVTAILHLKKKSKCKMAVTINSNTHERILHVKRKTQNL